ncbi:MAG: cation-translocating P-type ATPase, partial [Sulfurovum sp.]
MPYHTLSREEILKKFDADASGLSTAEAKEREAQYGPNTLPSEPEPTIFEHFIRQFKSPIIYVLLAATLLSIIIKEYTDSGFILLVLLLNAVIGTYQEYASSQKAKHLQNLIQTKATVRRDHQIHEIESSLIVPGDILLFEPGTKVSCDVRLLHANNLLVDESLLTGESVDIYKDAEFISEDASLIVAERKNMLFAGTFISSGRGEGVAVATGAHTQTGKIAALLSKKTQARIPLLEKMEKLTFTISLFIGGTVVFLFAFGLLKGVDLYALFLFSVALAVSTIPEGLPVAITVALTSASLAMSKRNVIVRKLAAIEGLGACTLIASDKTGTLTQNRLSVEYFISSTRVYDTDIMGDAQEMVYLASILCNEMHYEEAKEGKVEFFGDQVDIALARFAADADESYITAAKTYRKIDEIPYEPVNKFSAVMIELEGQIIQFSKGSPETVLSHCNNSEEEKNRILESVDEWAMKGYRTIALAFKESEEEETITLNNFTYLGFVAIIDPVRDEAPEAVKKAQDAGIKVVMVTGDHPNTALSIAKELGIAKSHYDVMNEKALLEWEEGGANVEEVKEKSVFSR